VSLKHKQNRPAIYSTFSEELEQSSLEEIEETLQRRDEISQIFENAD
jgi:hypothetical protein